MAFRKIILLNLLLCFIVPLPAQTDYNNKAFASTLNGRVKAVLMTVELFGENNDNQEISDGYKIDNYYDSAGIRTRRVLLSTDNETIGSSVYQQDESGNVIDIYYNDVYGNLVSRVHYTYNARNQWAEVRYFRGGLELREKLTYTYRPDGKIEQIAKSGPLDNPLEYQLFYYNAAGQDTLSVFLDRKKRITKKARYEYNGNNQLLAYRQYTPDGTLIENYSATYNEQGVIAQSETRHIGQQSVKTVTDLYDPYGNPVVETEQTTENGGVSLLTTRFTYTYDPQHNWISKQVTRNGKPSVAGTRNIAYYPDNSQQ